MGTGSMTRRFYIILITWEPFDGLKRTNTMLLDI